MTTCAPAAALPLLQLAQVTRHFSLPDQTVQALHPLCLQIGAGEQVAITGHSGSGKSTLLHLLGLLDSVSSGELWFGGHATTRLNPAQRAQLRNTHIGFVYQAFHLIPWMNALENIALPLSYAPQPGLPAQIAAQAREALHAVGLAHREQAHANTLSGGEKQRIAIARAIVTRPQLILADEPTGALDEDNSARIMALLKQISASSGAALVMVTHDNQIAASFARRLVMQGGHLLSDKTRQGPPTCQIN